VQNLLDRLDGHPPTSGPTLLPCRWEAGHSTGPVAPVPRGPEPASDPKARGRKPNS